MKQKLLFTSLMAFLMLISVRGWGQIFITELADPNNNADVRYIELYNKGGSEVDFTEGSNWRIDKYTNASSTVSQTLNLTGTIPAGGFYIIATGTNDGDFFNVYGVTANQFDGGSDNVAGSNGDDNLELYDGSNTLIDQFGNPGTDGTGTNHEFEDGRAERKATVTVGNVTYTFSEWNIWNDTGGDGTTNDPQDAPDDFDPGEWIGASAVLDPEPTNQPTAFTATANGQNQIDLNWDSNNGAQAASNFLIKASTTSYAAITDPTDANEVNDDPDFSDGEGAINVVNGNTTNETYSWTGLTAGTTYYFKIYPYTNSGANIDYNTNVTVPSATASTSNPLVAPTAAAATETTTTSFIANWNAVSGATSYRLDVSEYETFEEAGENATDLFISEYVEGSSSNKYIEIYNGTGGAVDLSDYNLQLYANGSSTTTSNVTLEGTLANGAVIVYKNSSAALTLPDEVSAENNSAVNFNGNDAVALYKISTSSYVDIFGVIGSDPGSSWLIDPNTTVNKTLVRKSIVTGGITSNPSGTDASAFTTLLSEWDMYDQDDVTHIGSHTFSGGSTPSYIADYEDKTINGTSETVTGLTANTTYYYRVRATDGSSTSGNSTTISSPTNKATETITANTNFSSLENVGAGTVVTVSSNKLSVDENAEIQNLIVEPGASVDVNEGYGLIISGDLHLKSPANNNAAASFIDEGTTLVGGNYIIERHINAYTTDNDGWHLLASPFNENLAINGTDFDPIAEDDDLFGWDEASNTWMNHQVGNPANFEAGKSYLVAYKTSAGMRDFTASGDNFTHLTGDVAILDNASRTNNNGWHLVGNSFLSAVIWDTDNVDWLASNVETSAQVLDADISGNYLAVDKEYTIQALQGFFVRVTVDGDNSLLLPESARVHSSGNFYKSTIQNNLSLKVTNEVNSFYDITKVRFQDGASQNYDASFDGSKLKGFTTAPQLYTVTPDNKELSVNVISKDENEIQIPLYFEARFDATYTISVEDITLENGITLYLTDVSLNREIDLNTTPTYSFTASEDDAPDRFLLHFGAVGIGEQDQAATLNAYMVDNRLYINNTLEKAQLAVYDLQGRVVVQKAINKAGLQSLPLNLPAGIYVLQLSNAREAQSVKINVQ